MKNLIERIKNKNTIYNLKRKHDDSIIVHHHLGLGDSIICNGLVNMLSKELTKIYLPVKTNYLEMVKFLYSDNPKITFFEVSDKNSDEDVRNFAINNQTQILKIGFDRVKNKPFNTWFYEQLQIPYEKSFELFHIPDTKGKSAELKEHLIKYYEIKSKDFIIVHNQSHDKKFTLRNLPNTETVYMTKESDIYGNMLFYNDIIKEAKEVHCINSSFLHLVERVETSAQLIYHDIRKSKFKLSDKWKVVSYDN
tara:strand:- start:31068 stop:31820 length:753 start_codon:yes stop_codon:yes gene_type:complete